MIGKGKSTVKKNGKDLNLAKEWSTNPRWQGVTRPYPPQDVERLRGSIHVEQTLARLGADRLWRLLHTEPYVPALGAMTGNQAVQQVTAGLSALYIRGWQSPSTHVRSHPETRRGTSGC